MTETPRDPAELEAPYKLQEVLGYTLTEWSRDFAVVEADFTDILKNRQGLLHGGIHALLLDTAMGYAGCYTGQPGVQQNALTLSMTVNYVGQLQGTRLIATGRRTGGGRKVYFAVADVTDDTGARLATATGVFRYRSGPLVGGAS
ncbi:PaaI family thioesterase [Roseovarius sp. M141]|uniref:PaaI family thioesterase n=1 Tax=Roseovarius sp. M141 TaxID=2583806 RepID=UPI0020CC4169|nr:PaaI family thioesterase [Roseovarius sp. M141]MCQ0091014.1 PaaI family thioesterase [Roseovarius sp. M141]